MRATLIAVLLVVMAAASAAESGPATTQLDIQIEPLVDLYMTVRTLAVKGADAPPPELLPAVEAARPIEAQLGDLFLGWGVLDRQLTDCESSAQLLERLSAIDTIRMPGGKSIVVGPDALRLGKALVEVEPAFLKRIWPAHRKRLLEAQAQIDATFRPKEAEALQFMLQSLGMSDPRDRIPLYLVFQAPWPGAMTDRRPDRTGGVCFVSVTREEHQGTLLFETILHEATHALDLVSRSEANVLTDLRGRLAEAGVDRRDPLFRNVPHTLMFIQAGETIRRIVAPDHVDYGIVGTYYERSPESKIERPIWIEHLDGKLSREAALARIVEQVTDKSGRPPELR